MTRVFTVEIKLVEPAILTDGSSDSGSGHETLQYIPGTTVLGAFVAAFGINPSSDAERFARLFLTEATRFLNAYPVANDRRTLPRPRTFRQGKVRRGYVIDRTSADGGVRPRTDLEEFFAQPSPSDRMKSARHAFILPDEPGTDHSPDRREQVHVGIDRDTRTAEQGVLFTYESLPAGTRFRGAILVDEEATVADIAPFVGRPLPLRLGRSRGAGYGAAVATIAEAEPGWREYEMAPPSGPSCRVVVSLLSDFLPPLEVSPVAALAAAVHATLGLSSEQEVRVVEAGLRTVRGFRAVWGLPRPARTAIERGAVVVIDGPFDWSRAEEAMARGIGSRRNEGFGRFSCGWVVHGAQSTGGVAIARACIPEDRPKGLPSGRTSQVVEALTQRRKERHRRRFVEIVLAHGRVRNAVEDMHKRIPPAQLGNLRAMMTGDLSETEIGAWFQALSEKTAGERWRKVRVRCFRINEKAKRRDGIGFVWTNLFGGSTDRDGRSDTPVGEPSFQKAIDDSLVPYCTDDLLQRAAVSDPRRTLQLFIVGFCGDVVRARNMSAKQGHPAEASS